MNPSGLRSRLQPGAKQNGAEQSRDHGEDGADAEGDVVAAIERE